MQLRTFKSRIVGRGLNKREELQNGYLLQNLPANVFYETLEGKIVENKKTKFSHAKQNFFTFLRNTNTNTNTSKCCQMFLTFFKKYQKCFLKKFLAKIKNFRNKKYEKLINGGGGEGGGGPNKSGRGGRVGFFFKKN